MNRRSFFGGAIAILLTPLALFRKSRELMFESRLAFTSLPADNRPFRKPICLEEWTEPLAPTPFWIVRLPVPEIRGIPFYWFGSLEPSLAVLEPRMAPGVIVPWLGKPDEIPEGWARCDGTHGTPDLRDKPPPLPRELHFDRDLIGRFQ